MSRNTIEMPSDLQKASTLYSIAETLPYQIAL